MPTLVLERDLLLFRWSIAGFRRRRVVRGRAIQTLPLTGREDIRLRRRNHQRARTIRSRKTFRRLERRHARSRHVGRLRIIARRFRRTTGNQRRDGERGRRCKHPSHRGKSQCGKRAHTHTRSEKKSRHRTVASSVSPAHCANNCRVSASVKSRHRPDLRLPSSICMMRTRLSLRTR